jgi:CheY-like chemotaxis protein
MKILWVEDEPKDSEAWVRAVNEELPARGGGNIAFAGTVDETVRMLDADRYDVVVLDLNIPLGPDTSRRWRDGNLNGKYVVKHLAETERLASIQVICLTNLALLARTELGEVPGIKILPKGSFTAELKKAIFDGT